MSLFYSNGCMHVFCSSLFIIKAFFAILFVVIRVFAMRRLCIGMAAFILQQQGRAGWRRHTGWQRCIACLIIIGHFLHKSPIISGSFVERDLHLFCSSRGGLDGGGIHGATPQHAATYCSTLENIGLIQMTTKYIVLFCISPIFSIFSTHGKFCMSPLFSIFSIYGKYISLICMSPIISIFSTHGKYISLIRMSPLFSIYSTHGQYRAHTDEYSRWVVLYKHRAHTDELYLVLICIFCGSLGCYRVAKYSWTI